MGMGSVPDMDSDMSVDCVSILGSCHESSVGVEMPDTLLELTSRGIRVLFYKTDDYEIGIQLSGEGKEMTVFVQPGDLLYVCREWSYKMQQKVKTRHE